MTIFSRRSIQWMLDALGETLTGPQLEALIAKLNVHNPQSLAAEWEVLVLFALSRAARISHEPSLGGTDKVDIFLQLEDEPALQFAADIRCISDRGLEDANPITQLMELIRNQAQKLGIRSGGFDHRVKHEVGRPKIRLKMPDQKGLHRFFQTRIAPQMKAIAKAPGAPWSLHLRDEAHDIQISYRPGSRYSSAGYPGFRHPTVIDSNPLYNALERKRQQLRDAGYAGPKGIIICDGGCETLTRTMTSWDSFSKAQIVGKFFDGNTSVSFVVLLWIDDPFRWPSGPPARFARGELYLNPRATAPLAPRLQHILCQMTVAWPLPIQNGENARLELEGVDHKTPRQFWGRSLGESRMGTGPNSLTFRMSARHLVEILAGQTIYAKFAAAHGFSASEQPPGANPFASALARGLTVSSVTLGQLTDQDDDWIEFRLTGPDPAISPFRTPKPPAKREPTQGA